MASPSVPNDIILFHYPASIYARRITWYLALRRIAYAQCIQPYILPRPDLSALGIQYRRIPLLSLAGEIYCDSRLILEVLEKAFPPSDAHPALTPSPSTLPPPASYDATLALPTSTPASNTKTLLNQLLTRWTTDASIFARCAQLIPVDSGAIRDTKFLADRTAFSGRTWSADIQARGRAEALVVVREAFDMLETLVFHDGRAWVDGGDGHGGPGMADLEAVWPFHWLVTMPGALPPELISASQFPRVWAWIEAFGVAIGVAKGKAPKPSSLKGPDAMAYLLDRAKWSVAADVEDVDAIDPKDPLGLMAGDVVEVYPIDSGFGHKDVGRLLRLDMHEVVIAVEVPEKEKEVKLHMPRWGFRIRKIDVAGGVSKL